VLIWLTTIAGALRDRLSVAVLQERSKDISKAKCVRRGSVVFQLLSASMTDKLSPHTYSTPSDLQQRPLLSRGPSTLCKQRFWERRGPQRQRQHVPSVRTGTEVLSVGVCFRPRFSKFLPTPTHVHPSATDCCCLGTVSLTSSASPACTGAQHA